MRLSHSSSYAVRAVVHLARLPAGRIAPCRVIAQAQGAPAGLLLKLLRSLGSVGVLESVKGPHGGYRLARPAKGISLLEIVEAVDGPVRWEVPSFGGNARVDRRRQAACDQAADPVRKHLGEVSVADLAGRGK